MRVYQFRHPGWCRRAEIYREVGSPVKPQTGNKVSGKMSPYSWVSLEVGSGFH